MHEPPTVNLQQDLPGSDASAAQEKAKLGILLVHGIGRQGEGVTLLEAGEPLLNWLRDWLQLEPRISHGVLKPSENSGGNCARFEFSLLVNGPPPESPQRLLVAECLWARQFDPPPFRELCGWLLGFGAWIALRQFCAGLARWIQVATRQSETIQFWAPKMFYFLGTLLVVVPLQLFLVALYILSLLPIEGIQKLIMRLTISLSEIIGDSYVFVASPVMRSAITSKLLADLGWLEPQCDKVVILAHSQGAAVAFDALRDRPDDKPVYLITYGEGIRKLFEMEQMKRSESLAPVLLRFVWLIFFLAMLAGQVLIEGVVHFFSLPQASMVTNAYDPDLQIACIFLISLYVAFLGMGGWYLGDTPENRVDNWLEPEMTRFLKKNVYWADLYASKDPIPGGPLLQGSHYTWHRKQDGWETFNGQENFWTASVTNERSTLADHTTYWNNADGFVVRVIERLNAWADLQWLPGLNDISAAKIDWLSQMRSWRVGLRCLGDFILYVSIIMVGVMLWDQWTSVATQADKIPVVRGALSFLSVLFWLSSSTIQSLRVSVLGIGAHLLGAWLYVNFVAGPLWKWWNELFERDRASQPKGWWRGWWPPKGWWSGWWRLFVWLSSIVILVTAAVRAISGHTYLGLYGVFRDPFIKAFHKAQFLPIPAFCLGVGLLAFGLHKLIARPYACAPEKPPVGSSTHEGEKDAT